MHFTNLAAEDVHLLMALSVVTMIPCAMLFMAAQKQFIEASIRSGQDDAGGASMASVELKGIGKIYDCGVRAVEDVNLVIEDGEFVVLVRTSGCGKHHPPDGGGLEDHRR